MSKRKSRSKSLLVNNVDLVFEDDSDPEIVNKILNNQYDKPAETKKSEPDNPNIRTSARAKKQKQLYDPSDNNGPVHKKKKEALEQAQLLAEVKKKLQTPSKSAPKSPSKTPSKAPKVEVKKSRSMTQLKMDVKKKPILEKTKSSITVPDVKAPKEATSAVSQSTESVKGCLKPVKQAVVPVVVEQENGASSSGNSEFETASTIEMDEKKVPDVSKWTAQKVCSYFIQQGFDPRDAAKFKEHGIDGEALLILNRTDLKELQLKVGTFVKIWNRILVFQTGSNDFTQGWK